MLEVISTLGAGFVKNLDDAFGVLPDCQPSRGFLNFNVRRFFAGSTSCSAEKKTLKHLSFFWGLLCFVPVHLHPYWYSGMMMMMMMMMIMMMMMVVVNLYEYIAKGFVHKSPELWWAFDLGQRLHKKWIKLASSAGLQLPASQRWFCNYCFSATRRTLQCYGKGLVVVAEGNMLFCDFFVDLPKFGYAVPKLAIFSTEWLH